MTKPDVREVDAIVANAPVGVLVTHRRRITRHNREFAEMFGFVGDEAIGRPAAVLYPSGQAYDALGALAVTAEEFEVMKRHTVIGRDVLLAVEREISQASSFLHLAREIAWFHHEKWDGTGYPEGLSGEAIPVAARVMAVADVYDALISPRVVFTSSRCLMPTWSRRCSNRAESTSTPT